MSKDLPSIDDFAEDNSNLPSINDYITEENAEELPSVEDFIEKEEEILTEATQTIEDVDGNSFAEIKDIVPPWPELVRMINDIREDIPDIPEVKYYDKELEDLAEQISNLPEVRYYDREVEAICEQIDFVREQVKDLPEVKYYDEQVDAIEDRIDNLQTEVANLPEVKYYDDEIEAICESIDAVKASIPKFPKWVNEVNEVPDFSWIGKTFSVIDDDFVKVNDTIEGLKGKVQFDLEQLSEDVETKHFNSTIKIENDISNLSEKVDTRIDEEKDKIWKELRSSSLKMWEYHKEFKDDDRKLKKQLLGEYNTLKQNINKELKEINYTSTKTDELLLKYFTELREEISGLPEVKYYDKDIDYVKSDIKGLYKIVEEIKSSQKQLKEEQKLLAETNVPLGEDPPETDNPDPLTPLNQDFVTLDQLQKHYKIFVERVQYQLSSIGGGGAGFIKDLDDVDISGLQDGYILEWNSSANKWNTVANTSGAGVGGTWAITDVGIHTTKNVGIATTARSDYALYVEGNQYIDGNITVGGTITYEDVNNVDSIGLVTARSGIRIGTGGTVGPVGSGIVTYYGDLIGSASSLGGVSSSFLLDYNNFTNTPTIPTNNNELTNGAGYITTSFTSTSQLTNDAGFITNNVTGDFTLTDTDTGSAAGPELTLYRNSASPAPGDYLGQIMFKGENSNGGEENYAKITGKISDETLGTEDGLIETAIKGDGSFTIVSRQRSDELQLLNGVGISVDGTSTFEDNVTINANISNTGTAVFGSSTGAGTVSVGVGTTALLVEGNARITGILTIGTGSITLDPNARKIEGIDEIIIGSATTITIKQDSEGSIEFTDSSGEQKSVGIGTTVSINTTGIITAATIKTSTAFYPPLYTTSARDAGTFTQGAIIFNTTTLKLEFYNGTSWQSLPGMTLGLTVALDG